MKQKHSDALSGSQTGEGMRGYIASRDKFMEKVLSESKSNTAILLPQIELEGKAKVVFFNNLSRIEEFSKIDASEILVMKMTQYCKSELLGKMILI